MRLYWLAALFLSYLSAMSGADAPRFNSIFNGTTLAGWHPQGTADWRVGDAAIIGSVPKSDSAGGWLVLDHAYEDFILDFSVRCTNCQSGVLLRDAPLGWSRFSHPANAGGRTSGLYVSLSGAHAGAMSVITLDSQGQVVDRKPGPAVYESDGREYIVFCATSAKSSAIPRDGPPEPSKEPVNRSYVAFALPNGATAKR